MNFVNEEEIYNLNDYLLKNQTTCIHFWKLKDVV